MFKVLVAIILVTSTSAMAMGDDYKKMPNGGYVFTGGSHIKGCSNKFQVGTSTKQFVVDCMKVDAIAVRTPDRRRVITTNYGTREIIGFGATTFYFQNNVLDAIAQ
jgi:hypothetical protein